MQHDYKLQNKETMRRFKSKDNAKRELFFSTHSLASIEQKKQSEHCMKDTETHGTRFCAWYFRFCFCSHIPKSNLHYTRGITPKRVTSGGAHLRCLAPAQHNSEEISQR